MTIVQYLTRVKTAQARHPEWRSGQTHFNVLCHLRPDIAEQIRGDRAVDPFYSDDNVTPFIDWVRLHWIPRVGT